MEKNLQINLKEDISKKTNNTYKYLEVVVGDWKGRLFVQSPFEMQYLEKYLTENK